MQNQIQRLIQNALESLDIQKSNFVVEHPEDLNNGDYSTNVAMVCAKKLKTNPKELAEKIKSELQKTLHKEIEKIEIAGAGFINFYLSRNFFFDSVKKILKDRENWGKNDHSISKKYIIEHTQPNPFKEFHIGHLMNNIIGEAVVRVVKASGAHVKAASYHGDVGMHVAEAVWAIVKGISREEAYALGNKAYNEDENAKKEILEINKKVYDKTDAEINKVYENGRKASFDHFESIYKRLDNHFDFHFYESEAGVIGKKLVLENLGKVFEESEGAVVFKGENFEPKTHTRVFLNSEKLPTYETKEVGLAEIKKNIFPYDQSVTITGNEQDAFFNVVEVAIGKVFPELKGKLKHLSHGMLKFPSGKMSSRTGNIIAAETLIDQIKEKVLEKIKEREFSEEEKAKVVEIVAVGAIKYSILHQSIGGDIVFDFEKSISFEGDSGPYLQYSYVRARSILEKAKAEGVQSFADLSSSWETTELERTLYRFPEVVLRAGKEYAPHHIANFLIDLARAFNSFYGNTQIVSKDDSASPYKLAITEAFSVVIKNGLHLLGIQVPEKM